MKKAIASLLIAPTLTLAAESQASYTVKYSGGSLADVKARQDMKLSFNSEHITLSRKGIDPFDIPTSSVTEVDYGQEVHHRIGTAVGLAVISLGIGALVAFSKSKKHYVGLIWDQGKGKKGGLVMEADKSSYRGIIAGLEGVTGKKAVDTDATEAKK